MVENKIRRGGFYIRPSTGRRPAGAYRMRPYGGFYMRPRKFALPQAGTGGYGIRPYVF